MNLIFHLHRNFIRHPFLFQSTVTVALSSLCGQTFHFELGPRIRHCMDLSQCTFPSVHGWTRNATVLRKWPIVAKSRWTVWNLYGNRTSTQQWSSALLKGHQRPKPRPRWFLSVWRTYVIFFSVPIKDAKNNNSTVTQCQQLYDYFMLSQNHYCCCYCMQWTA